MFHALEVKGTIRPLQDWLVVQPEKIPEEKRHGILVPANMRDFGRCPIVAAGPKCELKVGDVIWQQRFVEGEFTFILNGKKVFMMRERHANLTIAEDAPKKAGKKR